MGFTSDGSGPKKTCPGWARVGPRLEPFPQARAKGWAGPGGLAGLSI